MPGLLDLPPELMLMILYHLLPWGYVENPRCMTTKAAASGTRASLNALSQTCRRLHTIVRPFFYQHPFTEADGCVSLLRTLGQNTELAQTVRAIFIRNWSLSGGNDKGVISQQDLKIFNDLFEQHGHDVDGKIVPISQDWYRIRPGNPEDGLVDQGHSFCQLPEAALSALLVMLLPNLMVLDITSGCLWDFPFGQPNALPSLTYICLRHEDTENGDIDLAILKNVWLSAPNLHCVAASQVNKVSASMEHKALKRMFLEDSTLCSKDFKNLVSGLENLEAFSFGFGGLDENPDDEVTPQEMLQTLHKMRDTLKHISLDIDYFVNYEGMEMNPTSDLRNMNVLESLEIDPWCFGFNSNLQAPVSKDLFTSRLPPSIRDLVLRWPRATCREAILELARVAPEEFPLLEVINFFYLKKEYDEDALKIIREAFEVSNIDFYDEEGEEMEVPSES